MMSIITDQRKVPWHPSDFVEQGIKDTLEEVPAEQVILGVPFYTRVWELTPVAEGTDAEISEEDALRGYSISSEAVSMSEVDSRGGSKRCQSGMAGRLWTVLRRVSV